MSEGDDLAARFEEHRSHLRAVAFRMLGSVSEAEDAVQDAWLVPLARPALINGAAGMVAVAGSRAISVMGFSVAGGRIVAIDVLSDPDRLVDIDITVLDG